MYIAQVYKFIIHIKYVVELEGSDHILSNLFMLLLSLIYLIAVSTFSTKNKLTISFSSYNYTIVWCYRSLGASSALSYLLFKYLVFGQLTSV